jgi:hypothetical protein
VAFTGLPLLPKEHVDDEADEGAGGGVPVDREGHDGSLEGAKARLARNASTTRKARAVVSMM